MVPVLPPLGAGLLVATSLPPSPLWPLAPLGVALLAHANAGRPWRRRLANGLLVGAGQFAIGCAWVAQFTAAGYIVLVALESLFVALACVASPPARGRLPALAGLLTLAEWARDSWPFGGLPLGGIALGQVAGPLLVLARLGGPLLVVGATCLAGTALEGCAVACVHRIARRSSQAAGAPALGPGRAPRSRRAAGSGGVGAVALVAVCCLTVAAARAPAGGAPLRRLSVAVVQGGGRRGLSQLDVPTAAVLSAQLAATTTVRRRADLVVWPEDAVSLAQPLASSPIATLLARVARRLHATFVAGVTEPSGPLRFRNEAAVWGPSGRFVGAYEKVHPVPFGEYVPFRSLLSHLVSLAAVPRDAVPGRGSGMMATPAGPLALLVSYETFFADRGRSGVRAGGQLLVVPTNTASYASDQVPTQELAASQLQAVAEGRDLVQAASTGFSAIVDDRGEVLERSRLGAREVLRATVGLRRGSTLYERLGDLPVLFAAGLAAVGGWIAAVRRRASWGRRPRWPSRRRRRRPPLAWRTGPC